MTMKKQRTQRNAADWQQLLREQKNSNLTVTQFCKQQGLAISNFYNWRNKLDSSTDYPVSAEPEQVELWQPMVFTPNMPQQSTRWNIELKLPGGVVLNMRAVS